jgi:hypothetical protein
MTSAFIRIQIPSLPEKDIPVIGGAAGSKCTHLWTGDKKHFSKLYGKTIHGVRIVSNTMLAEEILTVPLSRLSENAFQTACRRAVCIVRSAR